MIKPGDTKKVIVLSAVAVVVLSVAVVRSIPVGDLAARVIATVRGEDSQKPDGDELPTFVTTNPFFHEKLIAKETPAPPETQAKPPIYGSSSGSGMPPIGGQLPLVGPGPLTVNPEDVAGKGQQSKVEPKKHSILVEAVLKAGKLVAMVSVDDADSEAKRVGDIVLGARIEKITDDSVVLRTKKGKTTLSIGRRQEL